MTPQEAFDLLFGDNTPIDLGRLTQVQNDAIDHFYRMYQRGSRGAILSTPTGTGKSRVGFLLADRILRDIDRLSGPGNFCLIITTATAKWNVQREGLKWLKYFTHKDILVIDGTPEERATQLLSIAINRPRFVVTNYDNISDNLPIWQNILNQSSRNVIIPDEADNIQNPSSGYSIAVRALCKRFGFAMTATPVRNRANSVWALLDFTNPGGYSKMKLIKKWNTKYSDIMVRRFSPSLLWGEYHEFVNLFCKVSEHGYIVGSKNMPELHRRLKQAGLVEWDKYDLLGIPKYTSSTPHIEMTGEQRRYYDARAAGIVQWRDMLDENGDGQLIQDNLLAITTAMKRACSVSSIRDVTHFLSSKLGIPLDMNRFSMSYDNAKADWAAQFIREHWHEGIFVWSQWEDTLGDLIPRIQSIKSDAGTRVLNGALSSADRLALQDSVQANRCKVLLSTPAGGAALNFQTLNHAIIFDLPWTARDVDQSIGRIERAGRTAQAQVWFPVMADTIEAKRLIKMVDVKKKDSDEILTGQRGRRNAVLFEDIDHLISML